MTPIRIKLPNGWYMTASDFDAYARDAGLEADEAAALRERWLASPWKIDGYWHELDESTGYARPGDVPAVSQVNYDNLILSNCGAR